MFDILFSHIDRFFKRFLGLRSHLPQQAKTLVWMIGLYDFNFALSSTFINIFLFRARDDWNTVGAYNLAMYVAIVPAFWLGGHLSKKWGDWVPYQLGFFFNASVFLTVLLIREKAPDHPIFLGTLAGLGIGFYYLGQHSLTLDLTKPGFRDHFLSLSLFISSVLRILSPALAGTIINYFSKVGPADHPSGSSLGYYLVFALTLFIYLALILKSFQMEMKPSGGKLEVWRVLTFRGNQDWGRQMTAQFILGLRNGVFWFIVGILIYRLSRNEAVVGYYNMMSNLLAVLTAYALSFWAAQGNRGRGLWVSGILTGSACLLLALKIDYPALLTYGVLNAVGITWFQVAFNAMSFGVLEKAKEAGKRKLEYLTARELPLAAGRLLSLSLFLVGYRFFGEVALRVSLPVFGFAHMGVFLYLPKQKKPSRQRTQREQREARI